MADHDRFLILACDPDEGEWTVLMQTTDADAALDFIEDDLKGDKSNRIMVDTSRFITFPVEKEGDDAKPAQE